MPTAKAARGRWSRSSAMAASARATSMPSESPRTTLNMKSVPSSSPAAAIHPAASPPRRRATRNVSTTARNPVVRATSSHSSGAVPSPSSANGVVKATGSGFQDGPPLMLSVPSVISRPQISHAVGS